MRAEQLELDWYIVLYCSDSAQEYLISSQSQDVSFSSGKTGVAELPLFFTEYLGWYFVRKMLWIRIAALFLISLRINKKIGIQKKSNLTIFIPKCKNPTQFLTLPETTSVPWEKPHH